MEYELPVAILDTSALYGKRLRKRLVAAALDERFIGLWSPHIIAELFRVLTLQWIEREGSSRASRDRMSVEAKAMMEVLSAAFDLVDTSPSVEPFGIREHWSDPDDAHLLTAAFRGRAGIIVSENTRDFPPADLSGRHTYEGIEFIRADEFFERLSEGTLPERLRAGTIVGEIEHP